jgi:hypothetical protein
VRVTDRNGHSANAPSGDVQCTTVKRYTVSVVRERLSEALDEADRGVPVIIERRGVRYRLSVEPKTAPPKSRQKPRIEVLDPEALEYGWTWDLTPKGLKFRRNRRS